MEKQEILTERNVVVEVLEKYKKLTYLWNPTHKLYTNKNARRQGLEIMLESWRKLEPNANIECIRKKLNHWRAAYRRERKKVDDSIVTATEPDEIHKPNLWYYDYLTFIHDECTVLSREDDDEEHNLNLTFGSEVVREDSIADDDRLESAEEEVETEVEPEKKPRMSQKQKSNDRSFKQDLLVMESVQNSKNCATDESSADLFGRAIGSQLKEISKFQRCLAEKLISEIMFYAKLEQLTMGTSINLESPDSSCDYK